MYKLELIYGRTAHETWVRAHPTDLRDAREGAKTTDDGPPWEVASYSALVDAVSFLSVMNKRLDIAFRGQRQNAAKIVPTLFRDSWQPPDWSGLGRVSLSDRPRLLSRLSALGDDVYEVCHRRGLPRWRTFERVQEARWAVIQHYGLWPTPLIDLTTSLRVAASFALPSPPAAVQGQSPTHTPGETTGWLYVVGLPNRSGSITYSIDDQMLVADLASVCPPDARRPHLQDGLLVGRFPNDDLGSMKLNRTDLRRRILAEIRLVDGRDGAEFWSQDFPRVRERSLLPLPDDDPLLADFATDLEYSNKDGLLDWRKRRRT